MVLLVFLFCYLFRVTRSSTFATELSELKTHLVCERIIGMWLARFKKAILFVIPVAAFACVEGGSINSLTRILSQIMLSIIIYELMRKEKV